MKKSWPILLFFSQLLCAQTTQMLFRALDAHTLEPLKEINIQLSDSLFTVQPNSFGQVVVNALPLGQYDLSLFSQTHESLIFKIEFSDLQLQKNLGTLLFFPAKDVIDDSTSLVSLSDDELDDDTVASDNLSGLLQSSKDLFLRTAAFEFSVAFFRIRGLDSSFGKFLLNNIEMNKLLDGRPQWSNWGGLNDVLRNSNLQLYQRPSTSHFGGLIGTTNISTRATNFRQGGRLTYSFSDRSYNQRVLASYATGLNPNNWAFVAAVGGRWGMEGFQEGTFYDAHSFLLSADKIFNARHSFNLTLMFTPNRRGKSSPHTQEVYDLKGTHYNAYWGYQQGAKRNARVKRVSEPIVMANHYWKPSKKTSIQTSLSYQFGEIGNTRIDYSGGINPDPTYYQKLPSYPLSNNGGPDYAKAFELEQEFLANGQINWETLYDANLTKKDQGKPSAFALYEDRNDDRLFSCTTSVEALLGESSRWSAGLSYQRLQSENFAEITDPLAGLGLHNIDPYDFYPYNLDSKNVLIKMGEKYRYHYIMNATRWSAKTKIDFSLENSEAYLAIQFSQVAYQRDGRFRHGAFPNKSKGKSHTLRFTGQGLKAGWKFRLEGRHWIDFNAAYIQQPPTIRNSFSNPRENNNTVGESVGTDSSEEQLLSGDLSYYYRTPTIDARLSGFFVQSKDATEVSFFFADGIGGDTSAFVQEILQGINKQRLGIEFGLELQLLSALKLKAVSSVGKYIHSNNPQLYLTSDDFAQGYLDMGQSQLKNYRLSVGPQQAYSLGVEYRDPNFWWIGATVNGFIKSYLDISPISRTQNFLLDDDGLPFEDYDEEVAERLLQQERFNDFFVVNLVGGKSWKLGNKYIGFFGSINNLLGEIYKTGGYEQARSSNYRTLLQDTQALRRRFGPKYWYGRGTTYFFNLYLRF
jgi:hypothetical protein